MAALRKRAGGLTFALSIDNSAIVLERLLRHEADVAVMAKCVSDPRLHAMRLRADRLVLFVPAGHALAKRRTHRSPRSPARSWCCASAARSRAKCLNRRWRLPTSGRGAIVDVQTREGVREAVAAGFGVGAMFASELGEDRRFRPVAVSDTDLAVAEYAVCLQERRRIALVRAFMDEAARCGRVTKSSKYFHHRSQ